MSELAFQLQFDSQNIFNSSQRDYGKIVPVDLNFEGDPDRTGKVSVTGIYASLQKIFLYFGSQRGDYLRTDKGGPFSFVLKASSSDGIGLQFRIISTANLIMASKFPEFTVLGVDASYITKDNGSKGWKVSLVLRHESIPDDIIVNVVP